MKGLELELRSMPALVEVVDDLYFKRPFTPGAGTVTGGATLSAVERVASVDFDNVTIGQWKVNIPTLPRWGACGFKVRIRYASPVGSTNTFAVTFGMRNLEVGSVVTALADLATTTVGVPGPAVAYTVQDYEWLVATPTIPFGATEIDLRIARLPADALDTNTNVLQIYSVLVQILPGPI